MNFDSLANTSQSNETAMPRPNLLIATWVFLLVQPSAHAADWQPATGPLKTRWAKDVSPANALPEYPRPQLVRKEWLNLNGLWDLKLGDGTATRILVPYPIESALSGVMKHSDRMTYHREVNKVIAERAAAVNSAGQYVDVGIITETPGTK